MRVLILFLSFAGLYGLSQGCSCVYVSDFEKYCNSDFAMLILVESDLHNSTCKPRHGYYDIKVQETFKVNADKHCEKKLYTAFNGAECGVSLVKNTTYLITGQIDKKSLSANLCLSWIAPYTPEMIEEVDKYKKDGICPATTR